ncbi:extensin family protein [Palleronia sp. KMU-117]|uniref:extensin-like domain-containing protein n=1 Tax=Palleronia sp. KMU-117 TaxID=3434108 RepID=UPI003D70BC37
MRRVAGILALLALAACGGEDRRGLCGVPGLEGERIPDVEGPGVCGIEDPVMVTRVAGVDLSTPTRMTCETASALDVFVRTGAKPVLSSKGGGLERLQVAAGYACRTRNSRPGARVSEHAKGRAIDISAFVLRDGSTLTVEDDWRSANAQTMKRLHGAACGPFGTVLGPESDPFHQDHFHFDVARQRSGPYCR